MMSIPGKRKRRLISTRTTDAQHRSPGRPKKAPSELAIPRKIQKQQLRAYHEHAQRNARSSEGFQCPFTSLPNELIQQIFFLCFEINLARASPIFAAALSNESTFNALILFAYFDDDGTHPVEAKYFLPAEYRLVSLKEKLRLQANILRCRWFTLERVRSCLPALSMLKMLQAWHAENNQETTILEDYDGPTLVTPNKELMWIAQLPDLRDTDRLENHFVAKSTALPVFQQPIMSEQTVDHNSGVWQPRIMTWMSEINNRDQTRYSKRPHIGVSVLAARVLPDWLLTGAPWTNEKVELLQLLRQGFQYVETDFVLEISAKAVMLGMANAIRESHVTALTTLLELHSAIFAKNQELADSNKPSLTPATHHPIPKDLFQLAATQKAESSTLLWLLVRAGIDSIPNDDRALSGWILRAREQAETAVIAKWLSHHMDGTNRYDLDREGHLFVRGAVSWRVSNADSNFPPASRTFSEELGYLMGGRESVPTGPSGDPCG